MLDHTHPDCLIISFPFSLLSCTHLFHDLCDKNNLYVLPEFGTIGIIGLTEDSGLWSDDYVHNPLFVHTRAEAEIALKS